MIDTGVGALAASPGTRYNAATFLGSSIGRASGCSYGLQLPRETVVETSGEFREAYSERNGNPERSLLKGIEVGRNVQRLEAEDPYQ